MLLHGAVVYQYIFSLSKVGNRAVLVFTRLAIFTPPYKKYDTSNEGNKTNENPPSTFAYIVQATDRQAKIRK